MVEIKYSDVKNLDYYFIENNCSKASFMKLRLSEKSICMDSSHEDYAKNMIVEFEPDKIVKQY